jgi:cyclic pyranopterin phosphate synthase
MPNEFSHLDDSGRARMVDVGGKKKTARSARAEALVVMSQTLLERLTSQTLPKGNPFEVVRIAGIQAGKKTSDLIPLCHPLPLSQIDVDIELTKTGARIEATAATTAETGVEMEALVAASVAALTLYDICKGVDKSVEIGPVRLLEKSGGKSGDWIRNSGT